VGEVERRGECFLGRCDGEDARWLELVVALDCCFWLADVVFIGLDVGFVVVDVDNGSSLRFGCGICLSCCVCGHAVIGVVFWVIC